MSSAMTESRSDLTPAVRADHLRAKGYLSSGTTEANQ